MMYKKVLLSVCIASLFLTSCSNDDPTPDPNSGKGPFLIQTTVKNPGGQSGVSYLQVISKFSGEVNNANGIQTGFENPISIFGNDIFVLPSLPLDGITVINKIRKYTYKKGEDLSDVSVDLDVPPHSIPANLIAVNESKAYMPLYGLGKVWIVNPKTMQKTGEIDLTPYAHNDNSPEPSYGIIRDGLYYLPLNQINRGGDWMPYEDYLQSDVAIIDVNTDKVVKVISEKKSHLPYPTRFIFKNMIFMNENKDIYIACTGFFGYKNHKENGFICIPAGKTEFDPALSWKISNTPIKGSEYKSASIYNCLYLGNGKVAAYLNIAELHLDDKSYYTEVSTMAALIDMRAKTIKQIKGIPMTDGHTAVIERYGNKVVFGSKDGFYTYDPNNGKVEFTLETQGSPGFFHYFGK